MNAAIPERKPATEEISRLIERVTFHDDENGFCVLRVKTPGHREEATVIGSLPSVTAGEWLVAEGWWVRDKEHGLQFKASTIKTVPPTTTDGAPACLCHRNSQSRTSGVACCFPMEKKVTLAEIAHRDPVLRRQRHCQILRRKTNHNAAWYYPDPEPAASVIKGRVAFWKGVTIET